MRIDERLTKIREKWNFYFGFCLFWRLASGSIFGICRFLLSLCGCPDIHSQVIDELYGSGLNKEFIKWHTAQKATLKAGDLDMSDMFLAPLARMGRYYAFLRNLERKTERDSIDFPVIEKVQIAINECSENTNILKWVNLEFSFFFFFWKENDWFQK